MNEQGASRRRILVLGANGQIGWELCRCLATLGEVVPCTRREVDASDLGALRDFVRSVRPMLVVNAAGYTAVDQAEHDSASAQRLNAEMPGLLAEETLRLGAGLIHYSTDYVFDGTAHTPYREEDPTNPVNRYGESKLAGEQAILATNAAAIVLRTSWVYGLRGHNFLLTIRRLSSEQSTLRVVSDQHGSPTWSRSIAEATSQIVAQGHPDMTGFLNQHRGIYHLTSSGQTSWHDFALAILAYGGATPVTIEPATTAQYPTTAVRPAYSVLDCSRLFAVFGLRLPKWDEGLLLALGG